MVTGVLNIPWVLSKYVKRMYWVNNCNPFSNFEGTVKDDPRFIHGTQQGPRNATISSQLIVSVSGRVRVGV